MSSLASLVNVAGVGVNGSAETPANAFNTTEISSISYDNVGLVLAANAVTINTTASLLIRIKQQHFSASGTRFIHKPFINGSAVGIPSNPVQTDNVGNWITTSANLLSITTGDILTVRNKTNSITSSLRGKSLAPSTAFENYLSVEIEQAVGYALFYYSKAANTAGDNELATFSGRALTQQANSIASLTLATDTITFPVGTYRIKTMCTHFGVVGRKFIHRFVDASSIVTGNNIGNVCTFTESFLTVATGTTAVQFKSRADSATGTPTMGKVGNLGEIEVYGIVDIVKL